MVYYRALRIDAEQADEPKIRELCNKKNNLYYVYGFEISKKSKKPHFHIVLKTERNPSTITKDIKAIFNTDNDRKYSNQQVRCTSNVKAIAYAIKDGQYDVHWDDNKEIDDALELVRNFKEEEQFKRLKDKIIHHLNKIPKSGYMTNTILMYNILNIFKEKELAYPSQAWIKNCMVTYYMQNPHEDLAMKNIESLYNIRDPFLEK